VTNFDAFTDVRTKYFTQELRLTSPSTGPFTYLFGAIYTDTRLTEPYYRPQLFGVNWDRTVSIKSAALFARGTYELTDADSITAGLRYQHDKLGYTWLFHQLRPTDPNTFSTGDSGYGFTGGEVSLKHKFTDAMNGYVTYSQSQTGKAYDVEDNSTASITVRLALEIYGQCGLQLAAGVHGPQLRRVLPVSEQPAL
jgi:iron complex outermembrane receptor protein